jgi:hypothetical protein
LNQQIAKKIGIPSSTNAIVLEWITQFTRDFSSTFVKPLDLQTRVSIANKFTQSDSNVKQIATARWDGTHVRISGHSKGLEKNIDAFKSIKTGTKNQSCVNIVAADLCNNFWVYHAKSYPATVLDMTVLQNESEATKILSMFGSESDIFIGDTHFHCVCYLFFESDPNYYNLEMINIIDYII